MEHYETERVSSLTEALQKRDAQFSTLSRLSGIISQSKNLEKALSDTLSRLLELTEADIGSLHLIEPDRGCLRMVACRGASAEFVQAESCIPMGDCLCGMAAQTSKMVVSPDLQADSRFTRDSCQREGFRAVVSIPLRSREQTLGILTLFAREPLRLSETDQEFLALVGHQIGVAIDNVRLYVRAHELAVLEERALIAREIHDGIAQSLAYLNLETRKLEQLLESDAQKQALSELHHIRQVIRDTYEDVRELLVDFRTRFKEGENLASALRRHLQDFGQRTGVAARLVDPDAAVTVLSPATQVQVFRIVQEALSNVRKHAAARQVMVSLSATPDAVEVTVRDDGRGFDLPDRATQGDFHLGLKIIRERAASIGGDLRLDSQPGAGTTVTVRVPRQPVEE